MYILEELSFDFEGVNKKEIFEEQQQKSRIMSQFPYPQQIAQEYGNANN